MNESCIICGEDIPQGQVYTYRSQPYCLRDLPENEASRRGISKDATATRVTVAGIEIPFWDMVGFMVKWAIAAVPAAILLGAIVGLVAAMLSAFFGAGHMRLY